jgi:hypothetical protein
MGVPAFVWLKTFATNRAERQPIWFVLRPCRSLLRYVLVGRRCPATIRRLLRARPLPAPSAPARAPGLRPLSQIRRSLPRGDSPKSNSVHGRSFGDDLRVCRGQQIEIAKCRLPH